MRVVLKKASQNILDLPLTPQAPQLHQRLLLSHPHPNPRPTHLINRNLQKAARDNHFNNTFIREGSLSKFY